ncbi:MAG: Protease Do [Berkelbacteria bacterium GW2011_GWB1_38_5]|uniref:Protease Do n=2 Tax=Candidatus Berkelbacteria TaxID=1618330 RepID=A0A0G0NY95_9BACT|nr:MAG: Protease Do [Berkelbacteria bacterium GW2011_GWB1_38_5]KKQ90789.1 MAG: Protease Do [Berkelbacteria bacterium GW2011_GWA1_39_10]
MPKINYLNDQISKARRSKGGLFIVFFLILSFIMGLLGGTGAILALSSNSRLQDILGIKGSSININSTKTEKLRLEESSAITDTVKKVTPAVVSITSSRNVQDLFGQILQQEGGGTGFIITNDGLILTNKHVAQSGDNLSVLTSDGKSYPAKIAALDPTNDLAILKIDASGLPVVDLGDSNDLQIGQWVIAVGNALGQFQNTVTIGVISARERQLVAGSGNGDQEQLNNLLQTDAAINSGNSGGPLVNLAGQVIGINTAVASNAQGIGFAITINQAKGALESYKKTGKIVKPYLGVQYVTLNKDIISQNNIKVDHGALIVSGRNQSAVVANSPADKAGIKEGDVVLEINGQRIDENHPLSAVLQQFQPDDEIELKISRDNKESVLKLKLGSTN